MPKQPSRMEDEDAERPRSLSYPQAVPETQEENGTDEQRSLFSGIARWFRESFGLAENGGTLREALQEVIEEHAEGNGVPIDPQERFLLQNILSFSELTVEDVMIPRADIIAIPTDIALDRFTDVLAKHPHTRFPVYEENLDQITGFVHVRDMIPVYAGKKEFRLKSVMRKVLVVAPSMKLSDLLVKMRVAGVHLAIVVDEYGGTYGLATLEDIMETIVGEISDEHDSLTSLRRHELVWLSQSEFRVDARFPVRKLEKLLQTSLVDEEDAEDFDTLGGMVMSLHGRVPEVGEAIDMPIGLVFTVEDADARRVKRLKATIASDFPRTAAPNGA